MKTILDERLEQAHDMSLGLHDAIHLSTHLLEELGNYLERRQRRRIHTSFDDLLNDLLPGLALAIHLLADKETPVEQVDGAQRWGDFHPNTQHILLQIAATLGVPYADSVADSYRKEVAYALEQLVNERTQLILTIQDWGEAHGFPTLRTPEFEIREGLEDWSSFCGNAPLEHLRIALETIRTCQQAEQGRKRLAQLSGE